METPEHIYKIVNYIRNSTHEDKEKFFEEKYSTFKTKYPQLYKMACNDKDFDMANLNYMLNILSSVHKKSSNDADVLVGQMLFDKYVKDKVPTQEEK